MHAALRYAYASIGHVKQDVMVFIEFTSVFYLAFIGEFERIAHEVDEYLFEFNLVGHHYILSLSTRCM